MTLQNGYFAERLGRVLLSFDEADMSRHSYLYRNVPLIDGNLGLSVPRISRQSVKLSTTVVNSSAVKRVPPLSSCLQARAQLQSETA